MNPLLIGSVFELGGKIIDRLFPDPAQKAAAELELLKLTQSGDLQTTLAQLEINAKEAQHTSIFVAGWRPFVGWVCVAALTCQYIARPLVQWGGIVSGHPLPDLPGIDDNLWQLMLGLLGLGGLRSYEKVKGVAR